MSLKVIIFASLIAGIFGYPGFVNSTYSFNYKVDDAKSGINLGHEASREGDVIQGFYFVLLPDSRLQKVTYTINGDSGFLPEVAYEGEAEYHHKTPTGDRYSYKK